MARTNEISTDAETIAAAGMNTVRVALAFSLTERYVLILMALGSNVLLARLLTPEQIGIFSVSLAVIAVAQVFRDFGVGSYLIQEKNLTELHVRTAFGVTLLIGATLFVSVWLGASWAANVYDEPRLISTLRVCSFNFLVLPFCTVSLALLRREMKFGHLAVVNVTATAAGLLVTLACVFRGMGEVSMAIGSVVTNVCTGLGSWAAHSRRAVFLPSLREWRAVARFGGQSSLSGVITSVSMDANDLFVAKILSFQEAALLSRAQGLMSMLNRDVMAAVRGVALPAFAAAHRAGEDVASQHQRSIASFSVIAWPFYGLLALYSLEALRLLYGPQWDAARPALAVFCAAGAVMAVTGLSPTLLVAVGRIDLVFRFDLVMQPLRLALIVGAALVYKDILACAIALFVVACISVPVFRWMRGIALPAHKSRIISTLGSSFVVVFVSLLPALLQSGLAGIWRTDPLPLFSILPILAITVVLWSATAIAVKHPLTNEKLFCTLTSWPGRCWRGLAVRMRALFR